MCVSLPHFLNVTYWVSLHSFSTLCWHRKTPDLKGTLKVPLGSSKALVFSAQANASKTLAVLRGVDFCVGRTYLSSILKHPWEIAACLVPWCSQFSGSSVPTCRNRASGASQPWQALAPAAVGRCFCSFRRLQMLSVCQEELERATCLMCLLWWLD